MATEKQLQAMRQLRGVLSERLQLLETFKKNGNTATQAEWNTYLRAGEWGQEYQKDLTLSQQTALGLSRDFFTRTNNLVADTLTNAVTDTRPSSLQNSRNATGTGDS